jgi:hypothetical protein
LFSTSVNILRQTAPAIQLFHCSASSGYSLAHWAKELVPLLLSGLALLLHVFPEPAPEVRLGYIELSSSGRPMARLRPLTSSSPRGRPMRLRRCLTFVGAPFAILVFATIKAGLISYGFLSASAVHGFLESAAMSCDHRSPVHAIHRQCVAILDRLGEGDVSGAFNGNLGSSHR